MSQETTYTYTFAAHPDPAFHPRAVFELFGFYGMVEREMTEAEFETFRSSLSHSGITLREVGRRPLITTEWEVVL